MNHREYNNRIVTKQLEESQRENKQLKEDIKYLQRLSDNSTLVIESQLNKITKLQQDHQVLNIKLKKLAQENIDMEVKLNEKPLSEIAIATKIKYGSIGTDSGAYPWLTKQDKIIDDLLKEIQEYKNQIKELSISK